MLLSNSHFHVPPEIWNKNSDYGSVKRFTIAPFKNVTPAHSMQSPPRVTPANFSPHILSFCAPVTLNCLMFFKNAISSLCIFRGVTLSVPATYLPGIFLLILNYLAEASAL